MDTKTKKPKPEYGMIQIDKDLHKALKQYTSHHGFFIKTFVQALIRQAIKDRRNPF